MNIKEATVVAFTLPIAKLDFFALHSFVGLDVVILEDTLCSYLYQKNCDGMAISSLSLSHITYMFSDSKTR